MLEFKIRVIEDVENDNFPCMIMKIKGLKSTRE